ncbi:MAG: phospholipase D-like domain-containing protein [Candidatus Nitrosocaldaceae archaeon]
MNRYRGGIAIILATILLFQSTGSLLLQNSNSDYAMAQSGSLYNYAPYFTATGSNFVSIPDSQELRLQQQFSVSAWFRTTMNNNSLVAIIVNKGGFQSDTPGTPQQNYGIWITGSNQGVRGKVQAGFEDANGKDYFVTSPNTYNDGQWHYAVVTYDGSVLRLYVDGSLVATRTNITAIPHTSNTPLVIGKDSNDSKRYFIGDIDEVRVYNRALTAQEVSDAYSNRRFTDSGLVVYISMPILLNNQEYYSDLLNAINNAKNKIYAHVYQLEYSDDITKRPRILLDALVKAKKDRGVDVRISFSDRSLNLDKLKIFLDDNGIPYRIRPSHAKIVVIDDKIVYIGSSNWRTSSLTYNNENNIKINNTTIVSNAKAYLDTVWIYSNNWDEWRYYDNPSKQEVFITNGYYDSVLDALNKAKSKIRLIMKFWDRYSSDPNHTASNLTRALVGAKERGVDVQVIIDDTVPTSVRDYLNNNGIPTKLDPSASQSTHAKSILIDNELYIGSHNWSGGETSTHEACIKTINSKLLDDYLDYFSNLWESSSRIICCS